MSQSPNQSPHEIALLCCGDDYYSMPLAVMICSASSNLPPPWRLRVFLMDCGILPDSRHRLEKIIAGYGNVDLEWRTVNLDVFNDLPIGRRLNRSVYTRFLLDEVLPPGLRRIIYLDGDMLVETDLSELWLMDFQGATLLAVRDFGFFAFPPQLPLPGLGDSQRQPPPYFNAGILLIDLDRWRQDRVAKAAVDYVRQFKSLIRFFDQDGLNAVMIGKWRPLDLSWNAQVDNLISPEKLGTPEYNAEIRSRCHELLYHPRVLHYAGRKKPWHAGRFKPVRKRFLRYLHASGWYTPAQLAAFHLRWAASTIKLALNELRRKIKS